MSHLQLFIKIAHMQVRTMSLQSRSEYKNAATLHIHCRRWKPTES